MSLPTDPKERKQLQLYTFMFKYFPDAWLAIVDVARKGNEQHNPGEPLHWSREKSTDQMNAAFNHLFDYGTGGKKDVDGAYHLAKLAWRTMAQLQLDIEAEQSIDVLDAMEAAKTVVPLEDWDRYAKQFRPAELKTEIKAKHDTCPWCHVLAGTDHRIGCPELELTTGDSPS